MKAHLSSELLNRVIIVGKNKLAKVITFILLTINIYAVR